MAGLSGIREARSDEDFVLTIPLLEDLSAGDPNLTPDIMKKSFCQALEHGYRHFFALSEGGDVIGVVGLYPTYNPTFLRRGLNLAILSCAQIYEAEGLVLL